MKEKDIYIWRYNKETLKKLNDGNNGGTTYWCCSQIAIWNKEKQLLEDTYWGSSYHNTSFSKQDIADKLILKYVANLNHLRECDKIEFNNYNDKDCINISHANMARGGFYIRKKAKPSLAKKKRVIKAHIEHYQKEIEYYKERIEGLKKDLDNLDIDTYVPCDSKVFI